MTSSLSVASGPPSQTMTDEAGPDSGAPKAANVAAVSLAGKGPSGCGVSTAARGDDPGHAAGCAAYPGCECRCSPHAEACGPSLPRRQARASTRDRPEVGDGGRQDVPTPDRDRQDAAARLVAVLAEGPPRRDVDDQGIVR